MTRPASGRIEGVAHLFPVRVYFEDTDAAGIVYYANYLKFAERARTEMMRLIGFDHGALVRGDADAGGQPLAFAVRHAAIDYRKPARLDDALCIRSSVVTLGGASMALRQDVERDGAVIARVEVKLVCMTFDGQATRIPGPVRAVVARFVAAEDQSE